MTQKNNINFAPLSRRITNEIVEPRSQFFKLRQGAYQNSAKRKSSFVSIIVS